MKKYWKGLLAVLLLLSMLLPGISMATLDCGSVRVKLLRSFCQETISSKGFIAPTDLRSR